MLGTVFVYYVVAQRSHYNYSNSHMNRRFCNEVGMAESQYICNADGYNASLRSIVSTFLVIKLDRPSYILLPISR